METTDVLNRLAELKVTIRADGGNIIVSPASRIPPEVKAAIKEHKHEILGRLRHVSDGQPPPLDQPLKTEQELRIWIDHTKDPEAFDRWLEWAMHYTDSVGE